MFLLFFYVHLEIGNGWGFFLYAWRGRADIQHYILVELATVCQGPVSYRPPLSRGLEAMLAAVGLAVKLLGLQQAFLGAAQQRVRNHTAITTAIDM